MKWFKFIITAAFLTVLIWLGSSNLGKLPPLITFFDPFHGFWNNGEDDLKKEETLSLPQLQNKVTVLWDKRNIPHIFAENNHDLYFTQGYLTAKQRLWQMDITSRVAAGRLSEIVGKGRLALDIENRSIGLLHSAKIAIAQLEKHPEIKEILEAYCQGANNYINSLSYRNYPVEFKLLNYKPSSWTPLRIMLIHKYMSKTLSFRTSDREMSNIVAQYKLESLDELFPQKDSSDPIIPLETKWKFNPVAPDTEKGAFHTNKVQDILFPNTSKLQKGSNNWAVSGKKTASGKPMLANDPHLRLSIPSIWHESQLVNNDVNVYGVTIPGIPGIVIGFNQSIAWGVTNQPWDVVDWYKIQFKDEKKEQYQVDGKWLPTTRVQQTIKIKGDADYKFDLIYTHHGPVVSSPSTEPLALRWTAHDASLEFKTFYLLNRAKNYDDYRGALEHYACPAQNFAYADVHGDIAMTPRGKFPIKPQNFGRTIEDGSSSKAEWKSYIPFEHQPFVKNPSSNFISSANQHPTNKEYPYYYNGRYEYYRNVRINQRLKEMENVTVDTFNELLNDNYNVHASTILPTLLKALKTNEYQQELELLTKWDYYNNPDKIAPSIFEYWWKYLYADIWDEFSDRKFKRPSWHRTVTLITKEPTSKWVDNISTEKKETINELINSSFLTAIEQLNKQHKPLALSDGKQNLKWQWGRHKGGRINHNLFLPSLGKKGLFVGGGRHIVNATSRGAGPSWRMVVEMTKPVKAWGVYPGGQSGNPGSKHYDDFVPHWTEGKLYQLHFLENKQQTENMIRTSVMEGK